MLIFVLLSFSLGISSEAKQFKLTSRIHRGNVAQSNQFPYMVSVREATKPSRTSYKHYCGAALISDRFVVTAAHCCVNVSNVDDVGVFMGTNENDPRNVDHLFKVKQIIIHEKFNQVQMINDIALLWTKKRVKFNDRIQPIPISKRFIEPSEEGVFTGFGIIGAFS